tara:strand:- start:16042 stop:17037 length:996 start_codon:yes stop_codon:yes gene_type:complete
MSVVETTIPFNPSKIRYVVACSGGNDSIALIQFMLDNHAPDTFLVLYNDTGWAREDWPDRIENVRSALKKIGVSFATTVSMGFKELARDRKGFPMPASAMQYCTSELKTGPTMKFLRENDPKGLWTVVTGRRREESNNRAGLAMLEEETRVYEGRDVYNPLVMHNEDARDVLIRKFGFEPLPHSSMECFPCVCSKRDDFKMLSEYPERIIEIKNLEIELGHTRNGKPRTMFRPYRSGGGIGIEQVMKWATGPMGTKVHEIPQEYQIPGVDYSGYRGDMKSEERAAYWANIKEQCVALGYDLRNLPTDIAYDDTTEEGREFARQCDGGLCGS